jgi:adenylate kinase family enzyme
VTQGKIPEYSWSNALFDRISWNQSLEHIQIRPCHLVIYLEASEDWLLKGKGSILQSTVDLAKVASAAAEEKHEEPKEKKEKNGEEEPEGEEIQMEKKSIRRYKKFKENTADLVQYYKATNKFHMVCVNREC